jgi:RNA polymerase sigma factor (sigma-70 family)
MGNHQRGTPNDKKVARLIRHKANKLVMTGKIESCERRDIEQELTLHWLRRRERFDTTHGDLETFADVVLNNAIRAMFEYQHAQKRDNRLIACSLDDQIDNHGKPGTTHHDIYDQDDYFQAIGNRCRSSLELIQLRLDIERAIQRLSPKQRDLARLLITQSASEAARSLKISRTTLYSRLKDIRRTFTELGLEEYL